MDYDESIFENPEDQDEYEEYIGTLPRLGASGITIPCIHGMVGVLTSSYQPEKITLISLHDQIRTSESVMFLIWGWPVGRGLVVIPDGFGTHGGGGGAGLSAVLGLIHFYQIPMEHLRTWDKEAFSKLAAEGSLTARMFLDLKQLSRSYDWSYYDVNPVHAYTKDKEILLDAGYHWPFKALNEWQARQFGNKERRK